MNLKQIGVMALIGLSVGACSTHQSIEDLEGNRLLRLNEQAVTNLLEGARSSISSNAPILVSTILNINTLSEPAALGKVIQEHLSGSFTKQGYAVVELKMKPGVSVKQAGDIALTREASDLMRSYKVQAILTGTYAVSNEGYAVVTLKLVNPRNNIAISAYSYSVPTYGLQHRD